MSNVRNYEIPVSSKHAMFHSIAYLYTFVGSPIRLEKTSDHHDAPQLVDPQTWGPYESDVWFLVDALEHWWNVWDNDG